MNRKQRREKFTGVDVEVFREVAYQQGVKDATSAIYASTLLVLRNKFGFGAVRAERFKEAAKQKIQIRIGIDEHFEMGV